jgi:hypothetical protein
MRSESDTRGLKLARSEFSRRGLDISRADFRLTRGVLQVQGILGVGHSSNSDVKSAVEIIFKVLKSKPEIKDIVITAMFR